MVFADATYTNLEKDQFFLLLFAGLVILALVSYIFALRKKSKVKDEVLEESKGHLNTVEQMALRNSDFELFRKVLLAREHIREALGEKKEAFQEQTPELDGETRALEQPAPPE